MHGMNLASATLQTQVLARLDSMIDEVAGLNEDRLFRRYREVIMASDRVNFFQRHGPRAVVSLAFKFAPEHNRHPKTRPAA